MNLKENQSEAHTPAHTPIGITRRSFLRGSGKVVAGVAGAMLSEAVPPIVTSLMAIPSSPGSRRNILTRPFQRLQTVLGAQTAYADTLTAVNNQSTLGAIVIDAIPPVIGIQVNAKDYPLGTDPSGKVMGWVYTETNGVDGGDNTKGYYVYNGEYRKKDGTRVKINLWDQFKKDSDASGGVTVDGYPVANPYFDDQGRLCLATQKRIRQYTVDANGNITKVEFMNIYDEIAKKGKSLDNNTDMVPDSFDWKSDPNPTLSASWGRNVSGGLSGTIEANHIDRVFGPLDANFPQLKQYYLSHPDWFDRFGLPMGFKEYTVNGVKVFVVRLQRSILQVWEQDMPWAKKGQVVESNAGDDAKKYGLIPSNATRPSDIGLGGGSPTPEKPAATVIAAPEFPSLQPPSGGTPIPTNSVFFTGPDGGEAARLKESVQTLPYFHPPTPIADKKFGEWSFAKGAIKGFKLRNGYLTLYLATTSDQLRSTFDPNSPTATTTEVKLNLATPQRGGIAIKMIDYPKPFQQQDMFETNYDEDKIKELMETYFPKDIVADVVFANPDPVKAQANDQGISAYLGFYNPYINQ